MVDVLATPQHAKADSSLRTLAAISTAHWVSHFHMFVMAMLFPFLKDQLGVGYEARIVSAHRTPDRLVAFARAAKAAGFKVVIAGAGGAAHLPGITAAMTTLPVFGVPVPSKALSGQDSLLYIVQMPAGVPVGTLAIGKAGAVNAALLAAGILALHDKALAERLAAWRKRQTESVAERPEESP